MPIGWGVDHAARLVSAKAEGELSRADIETYVDGLAAAATLSYRKVFDMGDCRLALSDDDRQAIGARIRAHEGVGPMGRVAVVAASDEHYAQARLLDAAIRAERPLRIFRDAEAAYDWLIAGTSKGAEAA